MTRAAAITRATAGACQLWVGIVTIQPNARTGPHHHGMVESVIYVVQGRARMRWGAHLEFVAEAGPGDFIYVPCTGYRSPGARLPLVRTDRQPAPLWKMAMRAVQRQMNMEI